jgi:formate dehydrogenase subunit gamma
MSQSIPAGENALELFADLIDTPGALMPILHRIQDRLGYVPPEYTPVLAKALNLSRAEVHGVITFYHEFRQTPPGKHVVQICQAESCLSMHCDALTEHAKQKLGADLHGTSKDGKYTLDPIYCLGNCALSPAMMVDGRIYGCVTNERFDAIVDELSIAGLQA